MVTEGFVALLIPWIWACAQCNEECTFRTFHLKERIFKWSSYETLVQKSHMQACKNKIAHKISRLPRFSRERNILYFNKELWVTPSAQMQNNNTNTNNTDWALLGQSCQPTGWQSPPWWQGTRKQRSSLWHRHGAGLCSPAQWSG